MQTDKIRKSEKKAKNDGVLVSYHYLNGICKMHFHDYYEIELVTAGSGIQNLNGREYPIEKGTIYMLTPVDFHDLKAKEKLHIINLSFDGSLLSADIKSNLANGNNIAFLQNCDFVDVKSLLNLLKRENMKSDLFKRRSVAAYLEQICILLLRNTEKKQIKNKKNRSISDSMQYIFDNFKENITLYEVAEKYGYSANYYSRIFKETTGSNFVDFVTKLRVNYAKVLLSSGDQSITEIALGCGFGSLSNFFRCFKNETGISAKKYRNNLI